MTQDLSIPAARIAERMGLNFPEDRWSDLAHALDKAAAGLGFDDTSCLIADLVGGTFGPDKIQALARYLTIPETHFFRSPETFAILQNTVLPELIAAKGSGTRKLRIWSAGCATGPEPYSLAILISRLIPDLATWDVKILATDINLEGFKAARSAAYTQWSFRGTPRWVTSGYFTKTQGGRYKLSPAIKKMVEFQYLNLVEDDYPSDCDLILCRNVVMYFARETAVQVADKLRESLREGGYLLVTASETGRDIQGSLTSLTLGGEIVYKRTPPDERPAVSQVQGTTAADGRKRGSKTAKQAAARGAEPKTSQKKAGAAASRSKKGRSTPHRPQRGALKLERRAYQREERPDTKPETAEPVEDTRMVAEQARELADRGRLEEALESCDTALRGEKLNPSLYYLKASILQELGRPEEAEQALQSTLFLDGDFALARVMLGAIARSQARANEAAKHFREAHSLLEQMPSDSVLAETDGLTAGEMLETVASLIEGERVS